MLVPAGDGVVGQSRGCSAMFDDCLAVGEGGGGDDRRLAGHRKGKTYLSLRLVDYGRLALVVWKDTTTTAETEQQELSRQRLAVGTSGRTCRPSVRILYTVPFVISEPIDRLYPGACVNGTPRRFAAEDKSASHRPCGRCPWAMATARCVQARWEGQCRMTVYLGPTAHASQPL